MTCQGIETLMKQNFCERWKEEITTLLSNGVIWIDEELLWEKFCERNEFSSGDLNTLSCLELEELNDLSDEELSREVILTFGSMMQQMM